MTLYSKEDIPYLKPIANLVATAHKLKGTPESDTAEGVQSWLLDALPTLSKKAKQDLKKRGVESRTTRGAQKDPKAGRKSRISTKPGFLRKEENKKRGAIVASRNTQETALSDASDESDFGGFD